MPARSIVRLAVVAMAAAALTGCAVTFPAPSESAAPVPEDQRPAQSDAAIERLVAADRPGCSAAVGMEGDVVWEGAAGLADLASGERITTATRFDMASVSKQFTATVLLLLAGEGVISLADPVARHVPGLPAWGGTVTLEQLLHHTSHVRDYWQALDRDDVAFEDPLSHEDLVRAIASLRTLEPGTGYLYSNSNYILLAEVIQRVVGQPYPVVLAERIFTPLGLGMEVAPNLQGPGVAVSYDDADQRQISGWAAFGATGIITTPAELVRWADQYRTGTLVTEDATAGAVEGADGNRYGAGINIQPDDSLRHDGRIGGYITTFEVSADRETAIVVMCNGHAANRFGVADALWAIWGPSDGDRRPQGGG